MKSYYKKNKVSLAAKDTKNRYKLEDFIHYPYQKLQDSLQYILLIPKEEQGMRRFCFLAFGLAVMTLSKIAQRKEFDSKDEVKLSKSAVMKFYGFTKIAVKSDVLMKAFFYLNSRSLIK